MHDYGLAMRAERTKRGLSLRALGERLDLGAQYLCDVEAGRRLPLGPEFDAPLAVALGIPIPRLETLRVLGRGVIEVDGLDERGLERVRLAIAAARGGDKAWARFTNGGAICG